MKTHRPATSVGRRDLEQIKNFKAEDLFDLLYKRECDVDGASLSTRQVARALTLGTMRAPTLRNDMALSSGQCWTDERWLKTQMADMDLRLESRSLRRDSRAAELARDDGGGGSASGGDGERGVAAKGLAVSESERVLSQRRSMSRLMSKSANALGKARVALHERANLVEYPPMVASIRKLGEAAITFKSGAADGGYERALNSEIMSPTRFDIFLRQIFNLCLTPEELGAVVRWMDADGNGFIDATEFLREFWKFGKLEHMRRDADAARRSRAADRRTREHKADWMTRFTHVTPAHVTATFTKDDFDAAERTLANAAADHEMNSVHSRAIREVFEGPPMPPSDFAEAIRRNWHVRLAPAELAALVGTYDDNGNGVVDGSEFYRYFTHLGRRERQRRLDLSNYEHRVRNRRALKLQNKAMRAFGAARRDVKVIWPEDAQRNARSRRDARGRVGFAGLPPPSPVKGQRPASASAARPRTAPAATTRRRHREA